MRRSLTTGVALLALLLASGGCSSPPPPPPPPQPKPEPPPPPKCNTLKDECKADADTRAPVPDGVDYGFQPPAGWFYANLPDAAVAQVDDTGAVIVATSFVRPKGKRIAKRAQVVKGLMELVGVVPTRVEAALTLKPPQPDNYDGLPVSLWEVPSAKRGGRKGALVVLSADVGDRELLFVGFAPADDKQRSGAIMQSLSTLSPKTTENDKDESDGGGDASGSEGSSP